MARRVIDFQRRLVEGGSVRRRVAKIEAAFAEPYRRERLRDLETARLLRERGTPERLIGPEARSCGRGRRLSARLRRRFRKRAPASAG